MNKYCAFTTCGGCLTHDENKDSWLNFHFHKVQANVHVRRPFTFIKYRRMFMFEDQEYKMNGQVGFSNSRCQYQNLWMKKWLPDQTKHATSYHERQNKEGGVQANSMIHNTNEQVSLDVIGSTLKVITQIGHTSWNWKKILFQYETELSRHHERWRIT
jgi:hypothetical protein